MKRNIYSELVRWKENPNHKPLVLLGARQVGKTYIVREFANLKLKGLRISMKPYVDQGWMENIPLYATEAYFKNKGLGTDV